MQIRTKMTDIDSNNDDNDKYNTSDKNNNSNKIIS